MLYRSDLVVADISTGNVNAVYELGVRHALRPNSTIIMKEEAGRLYFDLNHVNTFTYGHMGDDIGSREAIRAKRELESLIREVVDTDQPDSPVYTFMPSLQRPRLSEEEFAELVDEAEEAQTRFNTYLKDGESAQRQSRHADAAMAFGTAAKLRPDDPYLLQQWALATYKSKQPSTLDALIRGLTIIEPLNPEASNDPETLGITGAIRKRLWQETRDRAQLDAAVRLYGRGYEVRRDYYNGENLALCYNYRSNEQSDDAERQFDRMSALKVRQSLFQSLSADLQHPLFDERSDKKWVLATLANSALGLGRSEDAAQFEKLFRDTVSADWEIETFEAGKFELMKVL
jgi:hypothetical protein